MITVAQVRSASRYKGFIEQKYNPLFGRLRVAAGEEGGKLAVNDHWEDEHRAHEAGAEMPIEEGDDHSGKNSNVTSTHKWTTSHRQKYVVRSASRYK